MRNAQVRNPERVIRCAGKKDAYEAALMWYEEVLEWVGEMMVYGDDS
jgi:hypothetical protein